MKKIAALLALALLLPALLWAQTEQPRFDFLIKGGTVYDGSGRPGVQADVGIKGDRIVAIGKLQPHDARTVVDATGLAVAPGFINMLSRSTESLIIDGRSQSEIRQGVTTEMMGEGTSMGPLNAEMKRRFIAGQTDFKYDIPGQRWPNISLISKSAAFLPTWHPLSALPLSVPMFLAWKTSSLRRRS
ncbi:MAG: hypothetical protein ACM3TN_16970 [Alphaproteobacteria bacterium]